jgi:PadR family transcriptional regulator, regulatory protein AphA
MERSRTAYVLLGMLAIDSPRSGYDIRKAIESSVGYFWGESYGQIYPTLKKLTREGLANRANERGKQRRREYSITEEGRAYLRKWLALPFQNDPPRNEFLLKLFFSAEAGPKVASEHIRDLRERNLRALREMNQIGELAPKMNAGQPGLPYWMLTLGLGVAMTQAAVDWSEEALKKLADETAIERH